MKLKKTHILLMAIAMFLLIGIGSVCASENVTDIDDSLADDGTDVVLSDTDENVPDETSEEKINTTVETDDSSYSFKQDEDKTIPVEVKDNKSSKIDVNKSDLSISNGNKSISFDYNSSVIKITEQLPYGYYNLTISYSGNETYVSSYKNITVKIYGNNTIETETSVVCDGKNIEIPVKIKDQVEYIELIKNNFNLTLVYTNETGNVCNLTIPDFEIVNGTIKFQSPVDNLIAASLIIDYANATEPKTVSIKVSTEVKAEKDQYKFKSEEIKNISIEILDGQNRNLAVNKTDLKVFDNGKAVTDFEFNNSVITLNLGVGVHNITITYLGNDSYNASTSQAIEVKVSGNNTINVPSYVVANGTNVEIPVTIFDGSEEVPATGQFTLNLTYTNATGSVVKEIIDSFTVDNGIIKFNVDYAKLNKASVTINYVNSTGAKTVKINVKTNVNATPDTDKYRFNETNDITVTVTDAAGNTLKITKNDLKVFDNGKEITNFVFNETTSVLNVQLTEGVHNLTIVYKGDQTYNSSSTTIERKVYGDIKFNPDKIVIMDEENKVTITVNLNDGADPVDIELGKIHATLYYTINNQTYNETVSLSLEGQKISFTIDSNKKEFDSAYVNIKYDENNLTANTTIKVNTQITALDLIKGESEVKNFTIEIKGTNGKVINITKDNIQVLNQGKALKIEVNNSVITIKDALKADIYNLTIKYLGDDTYIESLKNITLKVYGINATTSTNINSTKKGEIKINLISGNETIELNLTDIKNITVSYKDGNNTIDIPINVEKLENGTLYFTLGSGNFTKATLTIKYNDTETNVTLNRIYNVVIVPITVSNDYQEGNFTFKVLDIDDNNNPVTNKTVTIEGKNSAGKSLIFITKTGTSTYSMSSSIKVTTDANGIASLANKNFYHDYIWSGNDIYAVAGNYTFTVTGSGELKGKNTTNATINKIPVKIVIEKYEEYYQSTKKVKIIVTNAKTGKTVSGVYILLNITGATLSSPNQITDANGTIQLGVSGLYPNTFSMTFKSNDANLINSTGSGSFTIKKIPVVINGKDVTVYYNTGTTYTFKVTKSGKAVSGMYVLVRLYSTSTKYNDYLFQTNSKGQVSFSASLAVGKHKVIVTSADTRYTASQLTKTITVKKASGKITAKKVNDYYKGVKYFTIKLTNSKNKKPIYDGKINIKVFISKNRYYNYNGNTGMNGQIKLALDNLKPGKYRVEVAGADNKNFEAKKITSQIVIKKAPAKLAPKKLTAKKGAKKFFKVKVTNKKTKKAIKGVKVKIKVYTGKKSKTYTVKTSAKGIAQLSTAKLKVGKHNVVVTSANKYVVAKKAKSVIKIKK